MLDEGNYKVRKQHVDGPRFHYLRVFRKKYRLHYILDNGLPTPLDHQERLDDLMDGLEIISKIHRPVQFKNIEVTIDFKDEAGDPFRFSARNIFVLRDIAQAFPRLLKAFGWDRLMKNQHKSDFE